MNTFTNSIELWIYEITSPSAYSRIKEALKQACFREITCAQCTCVGGCSYTVDLQNIGRVLLFGHVASFLKETVGVDGQRKWHLKRRNRDFENSLCAIISPFQTTLCLDPSPGPEEIRHFNDSTFYLLCTAEWTTGSV